MCVHNIVCRIRYLLVSKPLAQEFSRCRALRQALSQLLIGNGVRICSLGVPLSTTGSRCLPAPAFSASFFAVLPGLLRRVSRRIPVRFPVRKMRGKVAEYNGLVRSAGVVILDNKLFGFGGQLPMDTFE